MADKKRPGPKAAPIIANDHYESPVGEEPEPVIGRYGLDIEKNNEDGEITITYDNQVLAHIDLPAWALDPENSDLGGFRISVGNEFTLVHEGRLDAPPMDNQRERVESAASYARLVIDGNGNNDAKDAALRQLTEAVERLPAQDDDR